MRIKTVRILFCLSLVVSISIQAQTVTNGTVNKVTVRAPTPAELVMLDKAGVDTNALPPKLLFPDNGGMPSLPPTPEQEQQAKWIAANPTPPDLKNAVVCMDSFLGMTNAMLPADVISMKPESLKFRINGQDYNYSGHYTVTLNTPRQHKNPYFGFGSPETAKILILEDWGGNALPLQNATIWEKHSGFIDATAFDKEWIYSGAYTIRN